MRKVLALGCLLALSGWTALADWITHPDMAGLRPRNVWARQLERKNLAPVDVRWQNRHYLFRRAFASWRVTSRLR